MDDSGQLYKFQALNIFSSAFLDELMSSFTASLLLKLISMNMFGRVPRGANKVLLLVYDGVKQLSFLYIKGVVQEINKGIPNLPLPRTYFFDELLTGFTLQRPMSGGLWVLEA